MEDVAFSATPTKIRDVAPPTRAEVGSKVTKFKPWMSPLYSSPAGPARNVPTAVKEETLEKLAPE